MGKVGKKEILKWFIFNAYTSKIIWFHIQYFSLC